MKAVSLETDYLLIGSGAMGIAFADTLIAESDATVVMVDRHHRPGGHWNDAYSFVRLHIPSAFYGVNSLPLGRGAIDEAGPNRGLYELATGAEICGYFDQVMQQKLLPSGRVQYFPACNYLGNRSFVSLLSGTEYQVTVHKAVVDATYTNTQVPSMRKPAFAVADGVHCVPVNDLVHVRRKPSGYVILGAGKTAMDACLWLLERGVDPEDIRWIRPRDAWLLNRKYLQPGELFRGTLEGLALQTEAAARAQTIDDLFAQLSAACQLLRIDEDVVPTMYRCASVTQAEVEQLRRIKNVVRLGRVQRIELDRIVLQHGSVPTEPGVLHVDCTASGISKREKRLVFEPDRITLQAVRTCAPTFSAALIGHVEASYADPAVKNEICSPIPYPESSSDWLRITYAGMSNEHAWRKDGRLRQWIEQSRLNNFREVSQRDSLDEGMRRSLQRFRDHAGPALANLKRLLTDGSTSAVRLSET